MDKPRLMVRVREAIRIRHYSLRTEERGGRDCSDKILCSISGSFCRWVYRYGASCLIA